MRFHKNPSSGNQVVTCGQTDGRTDEANGRFSQFCEKRQKNGFKAANCEYVDVIRVAQGKLTCLAFVQLV